MLVSVIIAAYNVESHIGRALDSLVKQSHSNWEAIVVDDYSSDNTLDIVEAFARSDSRVRLYRSSKNQGPSAARNRGLNSANGQYVTVLDADDAFDPERLTHLISVADRHQADLVVDNMFFFDDHTQKITSTALNANDTVETIKPEDVLESERPGDTFRFGFLKPLVRSAFLNERSIRYDESVRLAEDFLFLMEILLCRARAIITYHPGYIYTKQIGEESGTASSGTRTQVRYRDRVRIADKLLATYRGGSRSTRSLLHQYRRWMKEAAVIAEITALRERSLVLALSKAFAHPRAAIRYIVTSSTFRKIKKRSGIVA